MLEKWINWNEKNQYYWGYFFSLMIGLSFLLFDWTLTYFPISDYLLGFTFIVLFVTGQFKLYRKQWAWLSIPIIIILINIILTYFLNDYWVDNTLLISSLIKLSFYTIFIFSFYNYYTKHLYQNILLKVNVIIAIISVIIALYIIVALYSEGLLPYEGLWKFTRTDPKSYLFEQTNIVRARSLFSEPAHLGYYLNTLLACILFNKESININIWGVVTLVIGVMLSMSYSAIGILAIIIGMYFILKLINKEVRLNKYSILIPILFGLLLVVFWDFIEVTIIERTVSILSGEDGSAWTRLSASWNYIEPNRWWFGNGVGHSPPITNVFAYILTDFGIIGFIPYIIFTIWMLYMNFPMGIVFILLNFAKGGYLTPAFCLMIFFLVLYSKKTSLSESKNYE